MRHEYGIAVLKPDGNKPDIKKDLLSLFEANHITVIKETSKRLSKKEVENHFAPNAIPLEDYSAYMTSSDCHAILVYGNKVGLKLQELKKIIREQYRALLLCRRYEC